MSNTQKPNLNQADIDLLLKQFKNVFATKDDIKSLEDRVTTNKQILDTTPSTFDLSEAVLNSEQRISKKIDRAITLLDKIVGNQKNFDEEQTVLSQHSKDHSDKLEDHAERISTLETSKLSSLQAS